MSTSDLRDVLVNLVDRPNVVVEALRPGPGAGGAVEVDVAHRVQSTAVWVTPTAVGPGRADARILDLTIDLPDLVLWTMRGGRWEQTFPPEAFAAVGRAIHPSLPNTWHERHADIVVGSAAGRSSDDTMPFLLLTDADATCGIWVAIGSSGSWQARLVRTPRGASHRFTVVGPGCEAPLEAGERLALPRTLVGPFVGDGWDSIRRWLGDAAPRTHAPWVSYNTWFNLNSEIDDEVIAASAEVAAGLGVEAFVIDAGWYDGPADAVEDHDDDSTAPDNFSTTGLGTWQVDARKFPNGLATVMDGIRRHGMIPGLWFEPERAHAGSQVAAEHPDWLRACPDDDFRLVDFGVSAAREWALETVSNAVRDLGLGWIKWDFNIHDVRPYWDGDDRAELAHQEGLYATLDALRARHPDLIIEMCASGGNRIDVETLIRCDTYWITDQTINPSIVRDTVGNAARLLPAQYRLLGFSPQCGDEPPERFPDAWILASTLGPLCLMEDLRRWPQALREQVRSHVEAFKARRHLLDGSVRSLQVEAESPLAQWRAWEFTTDDGEALLMAFRDLATTTSQTFVGSQRWDLQLPAQGSTAIVG